MSVQTAHLNGIQVDIVICQMLRLHLQQYTVKLEAFMNLDVVYSKTKTRPSIKPKEWKPENNLAILHVKSFMPTWVSYKAYHNIRLIMITNVNVWFPYKSVLIYFFNFFFSFTNLFYLWFGFFLLIDFLRLSFWFCVFHQILNAIEHVFSRRKIEVNCL